MIAKALSIAGSDPSGGAGIQADLKTFSALRTYGMAIITALTAQNTMGVSGVFDISPSFLARQMDAVVTDIRPDALKTGMLSNAEVIEVVAAKVREYGLSKLVVDPVMVSKSGAALLRDDAVDALRRSLGPLALLITPNLDEAEVLTRRKIRSVEDMEEAALQIHGMGPQNVLIKGGHLEGDAVDVLFDGHVFEHLRIERIQTKDSHGSGCVLSAAITAHLAAGKPIHDAVRLGKEFVTNSIRRGLRIGAGAGPCDPVGLT